MYKEISSIFYRKYPETDAENWMTLTKYQVFYFIIEQWNFYRIAIISNRMYITSLFIYTYTALKKSIISL